MVLDEADKQWIVETIRSTPRDGVSIPDRIGQAEQTAYAVINAGARLGGNLVNLLGNGFRLTSITLKAATAAVDTYSSELLLWGRSRL